jgi:hypothetical protein
VPFNCSAAFFKERQLFIISDAVAVSEAQK